MARGNIELPNSSYRFLEIGEIIEPTDLLDSNQLGRWVQIDKTDSHSIGEPLNFMHYAICRIYKTELGNYTTCAL